MSRLAEIYKSEKSKGGGLLSTFGKRALEKIDPRQMFDQAGLLAAVAPGLFKKYSATSGKTSKSASSSVLSSLAQPSISDAKMDLLIGQNSAIITNSKISATNSLVLPVMSRDINVMRQNIVKLVKLQGGTPATKADMFFKTSKEREAEYESKFGKEKSTTPTPTGAKPEEKKTGILGFLGQLLLPLLSLGKTIYDAVTGALGGLGSTILNGIMAALSVANLMKVFGGITDALGVILKIATSPFFLALAGITSIAALLSYLRKEYDTGKDRYMELAAKKQKQGSLSPEEEKEMKSLETPNYIRESKEKLRYDPVSNRTIGEKEAKQSKDQDILDTGVRNVSLRDLATEQLVKEGNTNPSIGEISVRAEQIGKKQRNAPNESSAETNRLLRSATSPTAIPSSGILDLISSGEAIKTDPYNSMNQGTPGGKISGSGVSSKVIGKNLTDMTVGEILSKAPNPRDNAEERKQKGAVFAAGRYQIIPSTLQGLVNENVVSKDEKFTPEVQDRLAMRLVEKSGATKSINEGDLEKAQYQLSKVWASLPVPAGMTLKSGQISSGVESFYGGANKAKENLTLASLQTTTPSRPASTIAQSTFALADTLSSIKTQPVVVNAPQTVNNVNQGSGQVATQYTAPSIVDGELMKMLVSRAV